MLRLKTLLKKLLRQATPDPHQLALQFDLFDADDASKPDAPPAIAPAPPEPKPGRQPAAPSGKRRIEIGEHVLDYSLRRSKRRSVGFLIDDEGLRISAPRWVTIAELEQSIREKQRWIFAKLIERRERSARRLQPQLQWRDGATLPYLGADVTLRILADQPAGIAYDAAVRELSVGLPPDSCEQQLKDRVQAWLQFEAKQLFAARLPLYAEKLDVRYHSFSLSSAKTQWGSCTAAGKLRLNWRLIHFSLPLIDYVIAHELAHLREMNHGPRFWATVQSVFPEFQAARKALRERAPETLPVF